LHTHHIRVYWPAHLPASPSLPPMHACPVTCATCPANSYHYIPLLFLHPTLARRTDPTSETTAGGAGCCFLLWPHMHTHPTHITISPVFSSDSGL
jgi:hypothetical protein